MEAKLQLPFGAEQMGELQDHFDCKRTVEMLNFATRNSVFRFSSKIVLIVADAVRYQLTLFTLLCLLRVCPRCFPPILIGNSALVLITCLLPSLSPWRSGLVATPWATACLWNPSDCTFLTHHRCVYQELPGNNIDPQPESRSSMTYTMHFSQSIFRIFWFYCKI